MADITDIHGGNAPPSVYLEDPLYLTNMYV